MNNNSFFKIKEVIDKNKEIILEVALTLNNELFNENKISYKMFKYTEENILKELKSCHLSGVH